MKFVTSIRSRLHMSKAYTSVSLRHTLQATDQQIVRLRSTRRSSTTLIFQTLGSGQTDKDILHSITPHGLRLASINVNDLRGTSDNTIDCVVAAESLGRCGDVSDELQELYRVLKPGGSLVIVDMERADYEDMDAEVAYSMLLCRRVSRGLPGFGSYKEWLVTAGFDQINQEDLPDSITPTQKVLQRLSIVPYAFVRSFGLQKYFPNIYAKHHLYNSRARKHWKHLLTVACKPSEELRHHAEEIETPALATDADSTIEASGCAADNPVSTTDPTTPTSISNSTISRVEQGHEGEFNTDIDSPTDSAVGGFVNGIAEQLATELANEFPLENPLRDWRRVSLDYLEPATEDPCIAPADESVIVSCRTPFDERAGPSIEDCVSANTVESATEPRRDSEEGLFAIPIEEWRRPFRSDVQDCARATVALQEYLDNHAMFMDKEDEPGDDEDTVLGGQASTVEALGEPARGTQEQRFATSNYISFFENLSTATDARRNLRRVWSRSV